MIAAERRQAGLTVVEFEGPGLDAAGAEIFRGEMRRRMDGGAQRIAVDLGKVESMESTGSGVLVSCVKYMGDGRTIEIRRPGVRVLKVLKLTRIETVFTVREGDSCQAETRRDGAVQTGADCGGAAP